MQSGNQSLLPPGSIDGATNPELIPDVVAFRLFFSAVAETASPSATQMAKQDAKLRPIELSDADKGVLVIALAQFKANLVKAQTSHTPLKTYLDDTAQSTIQSLVSSMSADGFQRLEAYVRAEKRFMKRALYPQMDSHNH